MKIHNLVLFLLAGGISLPGCQSESSDPGNNVASYSIGGTLNGLSPAQSVTLQNNGGDDLLLGENL